MPAQITLRDENASPRQIAFIERLVEERELTDEEVSWTLDKVRAHKSGEHLIPKVLASRIIGQRRGKDGPYINGLLSKPVRDGYEKDHFAAMPEGLRGHRSGADGNAQASNESQAAQPNAIPQRELETRRVRNSRPAEVGVYRHNDTVYVVRKRRSSDRVYAIRLVELGRPRLNEAGDTVTHDFVKAHGMEWHLQAEERITDDNEIRALCIKVGRCIMCSHAIWQAKSVKRMMGTRCWKRVHGLI
jgi:hypothetical protein